MYITRLVLFLLLLSSNVFSAIPTTLPYQGFLTNNSGAPLNSSVNMQFSIYDAETAGNLLWSESHTSVGVTQGMFDVQLGSISPFGDSLFDGRLYLGIQVGNDAEMAPRIKIGSLPFSFTSSSLVACANNETNCDGICADLQTDGEHCGLCDTACTGGDACNSGTCSTSPDADGDGYTVDQGDCDDGDPDRYPGAVEVCDGIDNDCDYEVDNGFNLSSDASNCGMCGNQCSINVPMCAAGLCIGTDADGDGYTVEGGDCDDNSSLIHPDAAEICNDAIDNDCDNDIDLADSECAM